MISDLYASIHSLSWEYENLHLDHLAQELEAEGYYKQAQEAVKSGNENLARTLLTQRYEIKKAVTKLKTRKDHIKEILDTLSATLAKLEPKPREHSLAGELFKDDDETLMIPIL